MSSKVNAGFPPFRRIVSLLVMVKFHAVAFHEISSFLSALSEVCDLSNERLGDNPYCSQSNIEGFKTNFPKIRTVCDKAELTLTAMAIGRLIERFDRPDPLPLTALRGYTEDIRSRYEDELGSNLFLHIFPDKARLYEPSSPLFGVEVAAAFPSAADDISEAGKCLATDRGTACVFHLMRVTEAGLKALAGRMKIPYAPSWESYLKQIASQLELSWKDKTSEWKKDEEFYREAAAHLSAVKTAWRNPTMHIVKQYTPESAEEIYNSVRAFMRHLAAKLNEQLTS